MDGVRRDRDAGPDGRHRNGRARRLLSRFRSSLAFWVLGGAVLLLGCVLLVLRLAPESVATQVASRARRHEIVEQMSRRLASAVEAERGAVMSVTDEQSKAFADRARSETTAVEDLARMLDGQLSSSATKDLRARFLRQFAELKRIDEELLDLAVRNTNLKASALAFGPASVAMQEVDAAFSRLVSRGATSPEADARRVMLLASEAEAGGLRIVALLAPHIAEESDSGMDALESRMEKEAEVVGRNLAQLRALRPADVDVETARSGWERFAALEKQILALSRENTNVRSLALSLNEKRNAAAQCEDLLAALGEAIAKETIPGEVPVMPR
jgi:hypothetical protein